MLRIAVMAFLCSEKGHGEGVVPVVGIAVTFGCIFGTVPPLAPTYPMGILLGSTVAALRIEHISRTVTLRRTDQLPQTSTSGRVQLLSSIHIVFTLLVIRVQFFSNRYFQTDFALARKLV